MSEVQLLSTNLMLKIFTVFLELKQMTEKVQSLMLHERLKVLMIYTWDFCLFLKLS